MRGLIVLICVALLVCAAVNVSGAHADPAVLVLLFSFLVVFAALLLLAFPGEPSFQPLSFLTLNISRAPPLA